MYLGINEKAWSGLSIVIYGKTPLMPMKLEQSIAKASPSNEVRIESFEDYDQAFDFCKAQKNIGLIFILENSGEVLAADIFKQLSTHYESKGWPCYGILFNENTKSMLGYLSLQNNKNIIGYFSVQDLLDQNKAFNTLNEIWKIFVNSFESFVIPEKLQDTLKTLAEPEISRSAYDFRTRTSTIISSRLNISWLEMIAIRWQPIVEALSKTYPQVLNSNPALLQISEKAKPLDLDDLYDVIKANASLPSRIVTVTRILDKARSSGNLGVLLDALATKAKPGAPALLKQITNSKEYILSVAQDYQGSFDRTGT